MPPRGQTPSSSSAFRVGNTTACRSCHLPLGNQHHRIAAGFAGGDFTRPQMVENPIWDATLMAEGVTCAACHVRDGVVVSTRAARCPHPVAVSTAPHIRDVRELPPAHLAGPTVPSTTPTENGGERLRSAGISVRNATCPQARCVGASRFAARPSHAFPQTRIVGFRSLRPRLSRGAAALLPVRPVQNTGAGHHIPTGSPFKTYRVSLSIEDGSGEPLTSSADLSSAEPSAKRPWTTISDNRISPVGARVRARVRNLAEKNRSTGHPGHPSCA